MGEKKRLDDTALEVWKKAIDTQMHFNELIIRNRTLAMSFVSTLFGIAIYLLTFLDLTIRIYKWNVHISIFIITFEIIFIGAYFYLDYNYYLKLLIGAVSFTEKMDKEYQELGLTLFINTQIPEKDAKKILRHHYFIILTGAICILFILLFLITHGKTQMKEIKKTGVTNKSHQEIIPFESHTKINNNLQFSDIK